MFVVLKGVVEISQRDGLGHVVPIVHQGPGHFLAEVGTLSGRPSLVDGQADEDVEALLIKKALARFNGNVSQAANALGLSRSALYRRLQRYGL